MSTQSHGFLKAVRGVGGTELTELTFEARTQLSNILGFVDMVVEDLSDDAARADSREDLHRIREAALRVEGLIKHLEAQVHAARDEAHRDPLTGIFNRRAFEARCAALFSTAPTDPVSLVLIDLDRFKFVNDTHGHLVGDDVLKGVVERCRRAVRDSDVLARLAGDEFVLLLPHTPPGEALRVADRLRRGVVETPISTRKGPVPVSVSVGVATRIPGDLQVQDLVERADRAMYLSKSEGRDRVTTLSD